MDKSMLWCPMRNNEPLLYPAGPGEPIVNPAAVCLRERCAWWFARDYRSGTLCGCSITLEAAATIADTDIIGGVK